jgi:anti-sigma B factor antagonist
LDDLAYVDLHLTTAELDPETIVITATGELDVWSGSAFDEELEKAVARRVAHVIVDLSTVPLIDSVVLGILMRHAKAMKARQGELVLVSDDPRTTRVIEITGLSYLFRMTPSLADAVATARAA